MEPRSHRPRSRFASWTLTVLFLAAITAPMVAQLLGLSGGRLATSENRVRVERPALKFDRESLASYPAGFEAYFNDAFGFRDPLIRGNSLVKVRLLGVSPTPRVVIGTRGWLYYADEGFLHDLHRNPPLTHEQLEAYRIAYVSRRDWLARKGIRYMVMFAPNKHTIYPEFIPAVPQVGRGVAVRSGLSIFAPAYGPDAG